MRYLLLALGVAALGSLSEAQTQSSTTSPDVRADGSVVFRLRAPRATQVVLRGEWQSGDIPLTNENGVWSVTVGPLPREVYAYSFVVDGLTIVDPQNTAVKLSARGATQSIVSIPADPPGLHDVRDVPHGAVQEHWYASKTLKSLRHMFVYTPPGYERGRDSLPVLVLLHGAGNAESNWISMGRANVILDNLIATKAAAPMLLVMPFGHAIPQGAPNESENNRLFESELLTDILPFVDATYRTARGAAKRGVAGLSMGGMQALALGLRHPDVFGWVGVFSPIMERDFETRYEKELAGGAALNKQLSLFFVGCGTEDQLFKGTAALHDTLTARGITHAYRTGEGRHSWVVWRKHLVEVAQKAFK
jgi:enterochelin esterase family protein